MRGELFHEPGWLSGAEFGELLRWLKRAGFYARVVDVKGAGYRVRDIRRGVPRSGRRQRSVQRCPADVAQLWFQILEAV